jgi:hypothetical protein
MRHRRVCARFGTGQRNDFADRQARWAIKEAAISHLPIHAGETGVSMLTFVLSNCHTSNRASHHEFYQYVNRRQQRATLTAICIQQMLLETQDKFSHCRKAETLKFSC